MVIYPNRYMLIYPKLTYASYYPWRSLLYPNPYMVSCTEIVGDNGGGHKYSFVELQFSRIKSEFTQLTCILTDPAKPFFSGPLPKLLLTIDDAELHYSDPVTSIVNEDNQLLHAKIIGWETKGGQDSAFF